ncbi:uncharacterized protein MONOS_4402 [Monocercomonoides exilis]|uniref:uncharacterized protein n=1 Tax=Monocercomonoides exilis TaxID=2049356 RepID=UPI00355999A2|nr:hypothetical protein MONOS_4402 [Monocercomonoides exilis]|eukprot:MONOS_4402.1-p1 / transcript=MONOS_4402.1 / gene=MONOS_4402 / organism=Monocercomonoides_exilis_PA203 / gene_product=unspecified product / transcript_product=unspecified product / location=Mono_scaffold00117:18240-18692(+) / protein_length=151 / sequence_SO=supercontig / SO=protein_coding / is_pseudo=false
MVLLFDSKDYLKRNLAERISHQSSLLLESSYFSSSSSSVPSISLSEIFVAASNASAAAVDDIERRLRIVVPDAAWVYGRHMPLKLQLLLSPRELRGYVVTRLAVLNGGVVCAYDVALSAMLSVTLVAPLPSFATRCAQSWGANRSFRMRM